MKTTYETSVEFCDVDFNNKIKLPSLFSYMLIASDRHVHINKISPEMLRSEYNAAWVLVRMNICMDTIPEYQDRLIIETWIENVSLRFSTRHYKISMERDGFRAEIGKASTVWTILDLNSRKICPEIFNDKNIWQTVVDDDKVEMPAISKKQGITSIENKLTHKVMYSDLDWNRHLNSGRYISMMMDASPILTSSSPIYFSIKYSKEVSMNELLTITSSSSRDGVTYKIENQAGEVVCSAAGKESSVSIPLA